MNLIPLSVFVATCPHVCGVQFTGIFTWPRWVRSATCTLRLDQKSSCLKRKDICQVHIGGKGHAKLHMSHTGPYIPCISAQQTTWVMSPIPSIRITARYHMNDNDKLGWAPNQSWGGFNLGFAQGGCQDTRYPDTTNLDKAYWTLRWCGGLLGEENDINILWVDCTPPCASPSVLNVQTSHRHSLWEVKAHMQTLWRMPWCMAISSLAKAPLLNPNYLHWRFHATFPPINTAPLPTWQSWKGWHAP